MRIPLGVIHTPESEFEYIVLSRDAHGVYLHTYSTLVKLVECEVRCLLEASQRVGGLEVELFTFWAP